MRPLCSRNLGSSPSHKHLAPVTQWKVDLNHFISIIFPVPHWVIPLWKPCLYSSKLYSLTLFLPSPAVLCLSVNGSSLYCCVSQLYISPCITGLQNSVFKFDIKSVSVRCYKTAVQCSAVYKKKWKKKKKKQPHSAAISSICWSLLGGGGMKEGVDRKEARYRIK